jgi:hypothetical protein
MGHSLGAQGWAMCVCTRDGPIWAPRDGPGNAPRDGPLFVFSLWLSHSCLRRGNSVRSTRASRACGRKIHPRHARFRTSTWPRMCTRDGPPGMAQGCAPCGPGMCPFPGPHVGCTEMSSIVAQGCAPSLGHPLSFPWAIHCGPGMAQGCAQCVLGHMCPGPTLNQAPEVPQLPSDVAAQFAPRAPWERVVGGSILTKRNS